MQEITKLIFATHNLNKLKELQALFPSETELSSLTDIGCTEEIPETSDTIEGNAAQKADYVTSHFKLDCFADDTGLEVEALNGEPGVFSARYAGEEKNNEANIDKLLSELEGNKDRLAQFKTVIALNLGNQQLLFTGICKGRITEARKGEQGFGYDAVFQPEGHSRTFAQMSLEEKSVLSHRGKAVRKLIQYLSK